MSKRSRKIVYVGYLAVIASVFIFGFAGRRAGAQASAETPEAYVAGGDSVHHIYSDPEMLSLVDSARNVIMDSALVMEPFMEKLAALKRGEQRTVSILHIGDSHIQAGFLTGRMRELFQGDFGDAGRGVITPHKMARMNEARDYSISTPYGYKTSKITDKGIDGKLGFTGMSVTFETPYNELKVWSKSPFNGLTVFHAPGAPMLCEPDELSVGSYCTIDNTPSSTRIVLSRDVDSLTLSGFVSEGYDDPTFYGFSLENGRPGVIYHSVGINGAAFEHFMNNTAIVDGAAAALCPDLIIVSLGTNNCYGNNFRYGQMYNTVDTFVRRLKEGYPEAAILLTTPMECCQRRGGRRVPNPNVGAAVEIICDVAVDNEVAYWDLYAAARGAKAMERWFPRGLANTDRIHLTENGYTLQGDMLYDALTRYYNQYISRE